ncbi:MAG: type-F conjugative transfer system pilin assembly protein TrbC [Alphaproteobacteria bacterium]|nr:type-F conjugative transfer system pilin assembly protein TrbC [Alphaproteobacteria bacterium]
MVLLPDFKLIDLTCFIAISAYPVTSSCQLYIDEIHELQNDSLKKIELLQQDKSFQNFVADLKEKIPEPFINHLQKANSAELTLFVSFSLGEKALLNLANEAKLYKATLVLRGFKDNSYAKTVHALQKIIQETGQGLIIDPELFSLFSITAVPTYILSRPFQLHTLEQTQTPLHDRLQGHVSLQYALETFAKEGDLKEEANSLLENAGKGGSQ